MINSKSCSSDRADQLGMRGRCVATVAHLLLILLYFTTLGGQAGTEQDLIAILRSDADPVHKAEACKQLRIVGTATSVSALAEWLLHERIGHAARYALEGLPYPEAVAAMRAAANRSDGLIRCGLIDSLGWRRDAEAVPLLIPWVVDADPAVGAAAAVALGRIGGRQALAGLEAARDRVTTDVRSAVVDGLLRCAEHLLGAGDTQGALGVYEPLCAPAEAGHVRQAAFDGRIRAGGSGALALILSAIEGEDPALLAVALHWAGDLKDPVATESLAALLPRLGADRQTRLLSALRVRGDSKALSSVIALAGVAEESVRMAAWTALGELGDASTVALLVATAATGKAAEQTAARQSLTVLHRGAVTAALVSHLAVGTADEQSEVVRALNLRGDPEAVPGLLKLARADDPALRRSALQALAGLAESSHLPALVQLLVTARNETERDDVRVLFEGLAERSLELDGFSLNPIVLGLRSADREIRVALLSVAPLFVDERLRGELRRALQDADIEVRDVAARALCGARDVALLPDLLQLARATTDSRLRSLAVQRVVRLVMDEGAGLSIGERAKLLSDAYELATGVQDQRRILSGLGRTAHPEALRLAGAAVSDATVAPEAELACLQIAEALGTSDFERVSAVLDRLASAAASETTRDRARALRQRLDSGWVYAGPFRQAGKESQELFDILFGPESGQAGAVDWRPAPGGTDLARVGEVDLSGITGGDHCVVYLKTWMEVPMTQAVRFLMGSDDGIKLWVNGELVHANNAVRGLTPDQDRAEGHLRAGRNEFFAKITQHTAGCGMTLRVTTPEGDEVPGLRLTARPWNQSPSVQLEP